MVLTLGKFVFLLGHRGGVGFSLVPKSIARLRVDAEVVVEGVLAVRRLVHGAEATRIVANVGVTTSSVVHINYGLGVDVSQAICWPLFHIDKRTCTYKHKKRYRISYYG
jgi:hypothetical protein